MLYQEAFAEAAGAVLRTGREYGIERRGDGYAVIMLRAPENRAGHELRCEVVTLSIARTWLASLQRIHKIATEVRAWLAAYHCLGGEIFRPGPPDSNIVLVMDFEACPILGYLDQHKYPDLVHDLFSRLDKMGLRVQRGATFNELYVFNKEPVAG